MQKNKPGECSAILKTCHESRKDEWPKNTSRRPGNDKINSRRKKDTSGREERNFKNYLCFQLITLYVSSINVALAEWLRRVPAKYMGFPRESSNLSGDVSKFDEKHFGSFSTIKLMEKKKNLRLNF